MIVNRKFPRLLILLLVFWSAMAETTQKQALDAIIARAKDSAHPQSTAETDKQLQAWAAKYKGTIRDRLATGGPVGAKPDADKSCPGNFQTGGGVCRLVYAETIKGKMHCYYACK